MKNEKQLAVCIYKDSTDLFTEKAMVNSNLCDMLFPEQIVRAWYKAHEEDFIEECKENSLKEPCFKTWLNEVYTADDTDGLYDFAVELGFQPTEIYFY